MAPQGNLTLIQVKYVLNIIPLPLKRLLRITPGNALFTKTIFNRAFCSIIFA